MRRRPGPARASRSGRRWPCPAPRRAWRRPASGPPAAGWPAGPLRTPRPGPKTARLRAAGRDRAASPSPGPPAGPQRSHGFSSRWSRLGLPDRRSRLLAGWHVRELHRPQAVDAAQSAIHSNTDSRCCSPMGGGALSGWLNNPPDLINVALEMKMLGEGLAGAPRFLDRYFLAASACSAALVAVVAESAPHERDVFCMGLSRFQRDELVDLVFLELALRNRAVVFPAGHFHLAGRTVVREAAEGANLGDRDGLSVPGVNLPFDHD